MNKIYIGAVVFVLSLSVALKADPPVCDAGSPPTAAIADPAEVTTLDDGTHVTGVGTVVHFKGTPADIDVEHTTPGDSGHNVNDTFDKQDAILWSEQNHGGDFMLETTKTPTFVATQPGDYIIILKVKDDGKYFLDFGQLTQVAVYHLKVVYPDGISVKDSKTTLTHAKETDGASMVGYIIWQMTYHGKPLNWKGPILEKLTFSTLHDQKVHAAPYSYNHNGANTGDWSQIGQTEKDGTFKDPHEMDDRYLFGSPGPFFHGSFFDGSCLQEMGFTDRSDNKTSLGKFDDKCYILDDQNGTFTPNETETPAQ